MAQTFGEHFLPLIKKRFKSLRGFLRSIPGLDNDTRVSELSRVLRGKTPPPRKFWEPWAAALELSPQEKQVFFDLAAIAHIPEDVRPRFHGIEERLRLSQAELEAIKRRLKG